MNVVEYVFLWGAITANRMFLPQVRIYICLCERITVLEECTGLSVDAVTESIVSASKGADGGVRQ